MLYENKRGLLANQATRKMQDFDEIRQDLDKASEIYTSLKRQGKLLSDADILIAAIALTYHLTLVTDDNHFDRIDGLKVENWLRESF